MKYDVFISYRRKGGSNMAEQLKMVLRHRHYAEKRIFMDTYSLRAGNYVEDLEQAIKESMNVVVVVTKGCFDGLSEKSNWVKEITTALKLGKNVVPIYYDGITEVNPEDLPYCLKEFPQTNAVIYSPHYVKASYDRLCSLLKKDYGHIRKACLSVLGAIAGTVAVCAGLYAGGKAIAKAIGNSRKVEAVVEEPVKGLVISDEPVLVDLGLPSGTLWLDRNIGAGHYYDYGEYYAFWETYTKLDFKRTSITDRYSEIKENLLRRVDYDVAYMKSDGQWRLPSEEEYNELLQLCTWTEAEYEGVAGRLVTGPSGYAIFLPAAGMKVNKDLKYAGEYGYYWTDALAKGYSNGRYGREMLFAPNQSVGNGYTYCGRSVRPVGTKKSPGSHQSSFVR